MGGVLFASLVWYYFPVYGGVHWFTGPVRNVEIEVSVRDSTAVDQFGDEQEKKDRKSEEVD